MKAIWLLIAILVVGGFFGGMLLAIPLGIGPPPTVTPEDVGFESVPASAYYLQSACPCFAGIPDFATDERVVSNTSFAQEMGEDVPDPQGLSTFGWAWGQVNISFFYLSSFVVHIFIPLLNKLICISGTFPVTNLIFS